MSLGEAVNNQGASARALYEKLEDRVLARDQVGASECYYDLVRDGRPLPGFLRALYGEAPHGIGRKQLIEGSDDGQR